ncbi:MAG: SOS response-associated peptidase [Bacilli bacterium]
MCGRFGLHFDWQHTSRLLWDHFQVEMDEAAYPLPQFNIAPTQQVMVLIHDGEKYRIGLARWGLPLGNGTSQVVSNARSESIFEKSMFRSLIKQRRCLVIASGFYEWQRDVKPSRVYWFHPQQQPLLIFAGLYQMVQNPEGKKVFTTLMTTQANALMAPIHDRLPVMLNPDQWRHWVHPKTPSDEFNLLFKPTNFTDLTYYELFSNVNKVSHNDMTCLDPIKK